MRRFSTAAKASGTLPQIVSWHELDPNNDPANDLYVHVADYRRKERELGVGPLPISLSEYGSPRDMAVPGALTRFVARVERAEVDTANLAFWHKPGRLADLVVDNGRPKRRLVAVQVVRGHGGLHGPDRGARASRSRFQSPARTR